MNNPQPDSLCIHLLGGFRISVREISIPPERFRLRKARNLIKILALEPSHRLHRDQLIELLWPDPDPETAANSLYHTLYAARHVLAAHGLPAQDVLQFNEEILSLCPVPETSLWIDVEAFETAATNARASRDPAAYRAALDLYPGDLLPEDLYEDWAASRREILRQEHLRLLLGIAVLHEACQDFPAAIAAFQRALAVDPACEEAHAGLMRLFALNGQRSAALAQYETCRQILEKELSVSPGPATTALYQQISSGTLAPQTPPTVHTQPSPLIPAHLPTYLIPFVGRQGLLASIRERLADPACRLLTLIGPGGTGKTRLAVEAVSILATDYPDGIFFVPLASVQSSTAIVPAIAQTLSITFFDARDPRLQILDYLRAKNLLLVLDNFEHLLEGGEIVTQILKSASKVKVLVTSRARLDLLYETLLPIHGMRIPKDSVEKIPDALGFSAVRLFLEGARRVVPDFSPDAAGLEKVLEICRLVEGMPLAILMAAAWLEILTPGEIAAEIHTSLDFLESSNQDLPERQRSMRAVFDHSWNLLGNSEQRILAALSVFLGGFSVEAAKEVCDASLSALAGLAGKSLIQRSPDGRFEIHELLRQYAAEKLAALPGAEQEVRDRHSSYFCDFLARREDRLVFQNEVKAINEVTQEIANLRLAWNWAVGRGFVEAIDRCQLALARYLIFQGLALEGKELFSGAAEHLRGILATGGQGRDERTLRLVIARLDQQQAWCCISLDLVEEKVQLYRSSLGVFQELGDRRGEAVIWGELGYLEPIDDPDKGFLKSIRIYDELDDLRGKAWTMVNMGWRLVNEQRNLPLAKRHLLEALQVLRKTGSPVRTADALYLLGEIYALEGKFSEAEEVQKEGMAIYRGLGAKHFIARNLSMSGKMYLRQGDVEKGKKLLREGIQTYLDLGNFARAVGIYDDMQYFLWKQGNFCELAALGQEAFPLIQTISPSLRFFYSATYDAFQAIIACSNKDFNDARRNFCQSLRNARLYDGTSRIPIVFMMIAQFLSKCGDKGLALELLEMVAVTPTSMKWLDDDIYEILASLEAGLSQQAAEAARERGRARDLAATVDELIALWNEV